MNKRKQYDLKQKIYYRDNIAYLTQYRLLHNTNEKQKTNYKKKN